MPSVTAGPPCSAGPCAEGVGTTVPGAFVGVCRTGGSLGSADGSDDAVDGPDG
ncbi:hypothetical protein G3I66_04445, partial [Streptomyces rubrogriseus]|nr:hypothetical protein [Streptomyces rubrogriseus]